MRTRARKTLLVLLLIAATTVAGVWGWAQFYVAEYRDGGGSVILVITRNSIVVDKDGIYRNTDPNGTDSEPEPPGLRIKKRPHYEQPLLIFSRGFDVELPFYVLLLALLIPAAIAWWIIQPVVKLLHCTHCDYNLTGNTTGACPECGKTIGAAVGAKN